MRDESYDETLIVPKLEAPPIEPPPTRKLVVQFAPPSRPSTHPLLWFVGAVILAIGFLQPLRVNERQLRLSSSAHALLRSLGQ